MASIMMGMAIMRLVVSATMITLWFINRYGAHTYIVRGPEPQSVSAAGAALLSDRAV